MIRVRFRVRVKCGSFDVPSFIGPGFDKEPV